jgi:hypothetical protein
MTGNKKPPGVKKILSPETEEHLKKTEAFFSRLPTEKGSDPDTLSILNNFAQELEENPAMVAILLKKVTNLMGAFPLWCLPELNARIQSKTVKKAIKKALYLLKQKGIETPSSIERREESEGSILKNVETISFEAYLSDFDGLKNQMVGLSIPKRSRGRIFAFALIGSRGLESLAALEVNKREVKDILADLENRSGLRFWGADVNHTAFLLKEAHDRDSQLSKEDEQAYQAIIKLLEGKMMIGQTPIIRTLMDKERVASHASDIQRLLQVTEILYLFPEPSLLESYRQAVQEVRTGILVLNEIQKRERLLAIVEKAVRESFPLGKRAGLLRFLEELAYLYILKKRPEVAEVLFYWANTLEEDKETRPTQESPLLLWLMESVLLAEEPGQALKTEFQEYTTDGGIILPAWVRREDPR